MEHAIIINRVNNLKRFKPRFSRVYFGNEFCHRLLPDIRELESALKITQKSGLNFTLLTSYADSEGLKKIKKLVKYLAAKKMLNEVVVNDFGILYYVHKQFPSAKIVLGRVLSRLSAHDGFIKNMGVKRIEIDYISNSFGVAAPGDYFKVSFYYPYILIQGTRYCPVANLRGNKKENYGIVKCFKNCLKIGDLEFKNSLLTKKIILRGNAQFITNHNPLLDNRIIAGLDRLVFQP